MKTFYFYSRNDSKAEAIDKTVADSEFGAVEWFAARKGLTLGAFLYLFAVAG